MTTVYDPFSLFFFQTFEPSFPGGDSECAPLVDIRFKKERIDLIRGQLQLEEASSDRDEDRKKRIQKLKIKLEQALDSI